MDLSDGFATIDITNLFVEKLYQTNATNLIILLIQIDSSNVLMLPSSASPRATTASPAADETMLAILKCTVSSKPLSTLKWFRLGSTATEITDGMVRGVNSLEYRIDHVSRDDAGEYRCTADNGYGGPIHKTTSLVVRCK